MTLDIVDSRAAWIDVDMELGGGSRPEVTIVFARKDAVAQADVFTPYKGLLRNG